MDTKVRRLLEDINAGLITDFGGGTMRCDVCRRTWRVGEEPTHGTIFLQVARREAPCPVGRATELLEETMDVAVTAGEDLSEVRPWPRHVCGDQCKG